MEGTYNLNIFKSTASNESRTRFGYYLDIIYQAARLYGLALHERVASMWNRYQAD